MEINNALKQLIPGYECLTHEEQNTFLISSSGKFITNYINSLKQGWLSLDHPDEHEEKALIQFQENIERLLAAIKHSDEYIALKCRILSMKMIKKYPYMTGIMDNMEQIRARFGDCFHDENEITRRAILWHCEISADTELVKQRLCQRIERLKNFFPLLQSSSESIDWQRGVNAWIEKYHNLNADDLSDIAKIEEAMLTEVIFFVLHDQTSPLIMNLYSFNCMQAQSLAKGVLCAFNEGRELHSRMMLEEYEQALFVFLERKLLKINNKTWSPHMEFKGAAYSAVSSILDSVAERLALMADGHAIIQATGFATQNENSHLAFLDFINYWRYAKQLSEFKTIVSGLLQPLLPLYLEYRSIGLNEKNIVLKPLRTVIPATIIASFVVGVFSLLTALALPELVALIVLIPSLYVGVLLATQYVEIKNWIYQSCWEYLSGGEYKTPYYQINARMLKSFGQIHIAEMVRDYYVDELQHCDAIERALQEKDKYGILTSFEIDQRIKNITRKNKLMLEWVDIHNNKAFGADLVTQLVSSRFHQDGDALYDSLKKSYFEHDLPQLRTELRKITQNIANMFENRSQNTQRHELSFFKSACLTYKSQLEVIDLKDSALRLSM